VPRGIDPEGFVTLGRVRGLVLRRKFAEALATVQSLPQEVFHDDPAPTPKSFVEATLYTYLNDKQKARVAFESARTVAERSLSGSPDNAARHALLGQILAGLGQKEAAVAEGKKAVELLPETEDALDGPKVALLLAQIYAWTGEKDLAFQLLDHSLNTPNGITVPILKLDPVWDSLRGDPRFQGLIDKYGAKD
jgi:tetratricopeptide (TPR) repeat protein